MNTPFMSRNAAEAWRAANPTPAPAQLEAFLGNDPRPLDCIPAPPLSYGLLRVALPLAGAVLLGIVGWLTH
jgi:hypothetical protein